MTTPIGNTDGSLPVGLPLPVDPSVQVQIGDVSPYSGQDQIQLSGDRAVPTGVTPPPESPQAPVPNAIGLANLAVKEMQVNLWLKYPNRIGALMVAMLELISIQSNSRFNEAQMQTNLNQGMFKLGMGNADLAKKLRDLQADQEFMKAVGSFMQAGLAFYQAGSVVQERGRTQSQVKAETDSGIETQNTRVKDFEDTHSADKKFDETALSEGDRRQYHLEKQKLQDLQGQQNREIMDRSQANRAIQEQMFRGFGSVSEGIIGLYTASLTREMGVVEKQKAINETLIQCFSKLLETLNKSRDEEASELQAIFQMLQQYSSETKSTISTRG